MPINLNALLRYKTIDRCLRNTFRPATIEVLIERCSEALTEKNGAHTSVSERTIRDDLRILRSDLLEFNAPIVCENGVYFYENPDYHLFKTEVKNQELLREIQAFLIDIYPEKPTAKTYELLKNISEITQEELPLHIHAFVTEQHVLYSPDYCVLPDAEISALFPSKLLRFEPIKPKFFWELLLETL